jgi:hypothetical protein
MSRFFHAAALSAVLFAPPLAFAQAHTIAIEGSFTTAETNTNSTGGPTFDITPVPLSFNFSLSVDADAPVSVSTFLGTKGTQVHFSDSSQSTTFTPPHPYTQAAMTEWHKYFSDFVGASFSQSAFEAWPNPQYRMDVQKMSVRSATDASSSFTSWSFGFTQSWRTDGLPSSVGGDTLTEAWNTLFSVELVRPADYTPAQASEPMTHQDLASFLDGFEEGGGTVNVQSHAGWANFVTSMPEANSDSQIYLTGDFRLVDMSTAPIPEPSTYALLATGLGLLAWRTRHRFTGNAARRSSVGLEPN